MAYSLRRRSSMVFFFFLSPPFSFSFFIFFFYFYFIFLFDTLGHLPSVTDDLYEYRTLDDRLDGSYKYLTVTEFAAQRNLLDIN